MPRVVAAVTHQCVLKVAKSRQGKLNVMPIREGRGEGALGKGDFLVVERVAAVGAEHPVRLSHAKRVSAIAASGRPRLLRGAQLFSRSFRSFVVMDGSLDHGLTVSISLEKSSGPHGEATLPRHGDIAELLLALRGSTERDRELSVAQTKEGIRTWLTGRPAAANADMPRGTHRP